MANARVPWPEPPHIGQTVRVSTPVVAVVMGSASDWPTMSKAVEVQDIFAKQNPECKRMIEIYRTQIAPKGKAK